MAVTKTKTEIKKVEKKPTTLKFNAERLQENQDILLKRNLKK